MSKPRKKGMPMIVSPLARNKYNWQQNMTAAMYAVTNNLTHQKTPRGLSL